MIRRLLCLLILAALVSACTPAAERSADSVTAATSTSGPAPTVPPSKRRIALVVKTLTNPFFVEVEAGARRAEHELGFTLIVKSASQETSVEQQIQIVEELILEKVDAIVISPGDSQRLISVLKRAQDSGISLVNIDNRLDPASVSLSGMRSVPFVSVDNKLASYQMAKYLSSKFTQPAQVLILEGIMSADNAKERSAGIKRAIAQHPNLRAAAKHSANWKVDEAYAVTKQAFSLNPSISAIFAANDMMALGAVRYLSETSRKNVLVAGYDAIPDAISAIKAGTMTVTVDQQASEQGYQGASLAIRSLNGSAIPEVIMVEARLVTLKTLSQRD